MNKRYGVRVRCVGGALNRCALVDSIVPEHYLAAVGAANNERRLEGFETGGGHCGLKGRYVAAVISSTPLHSSFLKYMLTMETIGNSSCWPPLIGP